jgi:hypothetical protein
MRTLFICGLAVLLTGCIKRHAVVDPPAPVTEQIAPYRPP